MRASYPRRSGRRRRQGIQVVYSNGSTTGPGATVGVFNSATDVVSITGNSIPLIKNTGTHAISIATGGGNSASRTQSNFLVQNNGTALTPLGGSDIGTVLLVGNNGYSDMSATINNNFLDANHTPNAGGGNGIAGGNGVSGAGNAWTPNLMLTVTNNTITDTDGNGILLVGRSTSGTANMKIQNNSVAAPINVGGSFRPGIRVDAGNNSSADDAVCLNISGNTSAGSNGAPGIGIRKQTGVSTTNDFGITGLSPSPATYNQAEDFVASLNPLSALGTAADGGQKRAIAIAGDNFVSCTTAPQ